MGNEVSVVLEAWRAAVREADAAPHGSIERIRAEEKARELRERYHAEVLRMRGRTDQLEAEAATSWARLAGSRAILDGAFITDPEPDRDDGPQPEPSPLEDDPTRA